MLIVPLKHLLHDPPMSSTMPHADCLQNPLENLVGFQLRQTSLAITSDLTDRLTALSLTLVSLSVLLIIEANPGVTQSDLCRQLGVKRANMTPLAYQFGERGLIARQPADGRSQGLHLTTAGHDLAAAARRIVAANEATFLAGLTSDQQAELRDALASLHAARIVAATTRQA